MKIWFYPLAFIVMLILVSGCTVYDTGLSGVIIKYDCVPLDEKVYFESNKIYSNNTNSCNFIRQNADISIPYYLDDDTLIGNIDSELKLEQNCKKSLELPEFAYVLVSSSDEKIFGCVPVVDE